MALPVTPRGAYKAGVHRLAWVVVGALSIGSPSARAEPATGGSSQAAEPGRMIFGAGHRGTLEIIDEQGAPVASVALRADHPVVVQLPAGRYTLRDATGRAVETVVLSAGQAQAVELPETFRAEAPASASGPGPVEPDRPVVVTGRLGPATPDAQQEVELVPRRRWARWAAPLLSAVVPGAGQGLNRQPGRGLAAFTGTLGLVLGTLALRSARDPTAGASADGPTRSSARELSRLLGLAGLSSAAGLLYVGQILDAHAQAVRRGPVTPRRRHVLALELTRFTTVGFSAGQPAYDLYSDWSLGIMGQLVPRVSFGLADASIKYARYRELLTVQAGARATYRFYDRRRIWLSAGGGLLFQGTRGDPSVEPVSEGDAAVAAGSSSERSFSAVPYVLFDARLFLLERWSLGLTPRVSVPLQPRRFGRGRALPRYATTFELGATMGVYF